jgi:hypothetical protein
MLDQRVIGMNLFGAMALGCSLILPGTAAMSATENMIKANAVVCATKSGIEASRNDMNAKQLESLGCDTTPTSLRIDVLPSSSACDRYLHVAATLPDKILRYWIRRDELDDQVISSIRGDMQCRD